MIIVGGGAAGLIASIAASRRGLKTAVLEKMAKPGRKLGISGKGRGNLTNTADYKDFLNHFNNSGRFLKFAFRKFFSQDLIDFFFQLGLQSVTERGGRVFTASGKATDAVRCLHEAAISLGVKFETDFCVKDLQINGSSCSGVVSQSGKKLYSQTTLLCTGGLSYPLTGSTGDGLIMAEKYGHRIITPRPSLVPLKSEETIPEALDRIILKNISAQLRIDGRKIAEERGEMAFMDGFIAGPVIITLSRIAVAEISADKKVEIAVDLKPALDHQQLDRRILREIEKDPKLSIAGLLRKLLPSPMPLFICKRLGIMPELTAAKLRSEQRKQIRNSLKELVFRIIGHAPWSQAIVTAGGIDTSEVFSETMESKLIKNLFFAGEILNIDADTGGYNLQAAFSTGWLAANSVADRLFSLKSGIQE